MSEAICGTGANQLPGCRFAHPGYACCVCLAGKHSIRINDQSRIVFRWTDASPEDVEIID
jgi:plasmid maintenance system killer protein